MESRPWRVVVARPRAAAGERHLRIRARRRRADGGYDEHVISTGTLDPAAAERARAAHERELTLGRVVAERRDPSVIDALDLRIAAMEAADATSKTIRTYQNARAAFAASLADVRDSGLGRAALLVGRDALVARGAHRASTINLYVRVLAAAWRWCLDRDLVRTPWPRLRPLVEQTTPKRPLTDAELARVLERLRVAEGGRWHALFAVLAATGARVTGHASLAVFDGYQRNAVGDDLRAAVEAVAARRRAAENLPGTSPASQAEERETPGTTGLGERADVDPRYAREASISTQPQAAAGSAARVGGEGERTPAQDVATRCASILGRPDPLDAVTARWAAENPAAMRRLLRVTAAAHLAALDELVPEGTPAAAEPPKEVARGRGAC